MKSKVGESVIHPFLSVAVAGSELVVRVGALLRVLGQRVVDAAEGVAAEVARALTHVRHAVPREESEMRIEVNWTLIFQFCSY